MTSRFRICLDRVLKHEGGYVNHPDDPGGATNQGVTQAVYDAYRRDHFLPTQTVRYIARTELEAIYHDRYWLKIRGDDLPAGVDSCTFDAAVNSGPARGAKWLQRAAGATADGAVGPDTLAAVRAKAPAAIVNAMCDERMAFLRRLRHWPTFGRGWTRRVDSVRRDALADALASPQPPQDARKATAAPVTAPPPSARPRGFWARLLGPKLAAWLGLACLLVLVALPALAQQVMQCGERKVIVAALADKFGETRRSVGLQQGRGLIEVYASDKTGTWTILVTSPAGRSCLIAAGEALGRTALTVR